ncbi:MAG: PorT family protein [Bacteroidetes bacterium]|nr:PorT family protein [Bacteroidota bacterium]
MKYFLILVCLLFTTLTFAQDLDDVAENFNNSGNRDRLILELNHDNWLNGPDTVTTEWYSRGINFYFMFDAQLGTSNFSIAPGIGIGNRNLFSDVSFIEDTNETLVVPYSSTLYYPNGFDYIKNKLVTTYLDIPVELRYRTKPNSKNNSFKIAVGIKAGFLLGSHSKLKSKDQFDEARVYKVNKIRNLNKFRYGATFRVGYSEFNLIVFYGLSTLFEANKGPGINPISVGISFNAL